MSTAQQKTIDTLQTMMAKNLVEVPVIRDNTALNIYESKDGRINVSLNKNTFASESIKQLVSLWNMFKIRTVRLAELQGLCARQHGLLNDDSGYRITMNDAMLALEDDGSVERIKYANDVVYVRLTTGYLKSL